MGVVDIVGGHHRKLKAASYLPHHIVPDVVLRHTVMPQLDVQAPPEEFSQPSRGLECSIQIAALRGARYGPLPAAGERIQLSLLGGGLQIRPGVSGSVLFAAKLCPRNQPAEGSVPLR